MARCIAEGLASGQRLAAGARIIQADANRQNSTPKSDWRPASIDPMDAPRAVREYLDKLDDAAFGAASPLEPKFTSHSDPASQWTGARGGPAHFAYATNYLIDTLGLPPERLLADTASGTGARLDWPDHRRSIAPHNPVVDKSARRDATFERADFAYDAEADVYTYPGGKALKQSRRTITKPREEKRDEYCMLRYRPGKADGDTCTLKSRCCPKEPAPKILRSVFEPSRDRARAIAQTTDYVISCKLRK